MNSFYGAGYRALQALRGGSVVHSLAFAGTFEGRLWNFALICRLQACPIEMLTSELWGVWRRFGELPPFVDWRLTGIGYVSSQLFSLSSCKKLFSINYFFWRQHQLLPSTFLVLLLPFCFAFFLDFLKILTV